MSLVSKTKNKQTNLKYDQTNENRLCIKSKTPEEISGVSHKSVSSKLQEGKDLQ